MASPAGQTNQRGLAVFRILSQLNSVDYIIILLSHLPHHAPALNSLVCAAVLLRNYSLTHPPTFYPL